MIEVDTTNILFICGGAFVGLDKIINKRLNTSAIGFGRAIETDKNLKNSVQPEDVIKFGMIPELVGRLPVLVSVLELTRDEMKDILIKPENSLLKQIQKLFKMESIELEITSDAIDLIVESSYEKKLGARALKTVVEDVLLEIQYELPSYRKKGVARVVVNKDTIETRNPLLIYEETGTDSK
jgi:ATP-dependent Clp protease ATP-binding subunit ClpX